MIGKLTQKGNTIVFENVDVGVEYQKGIGSFDFRYTATGVTIYCEKLELFDDIYANIRDSTNIPFTRTTLKDFIGAFGDGSGGGGSPTTPTVILEKDNYLIDAAGRRRGSPPVLLAEYSSVNFRNDRLIDFQGNGKADYRDGTYGLAGVEMSVGGGEYIIGETKNPHKYVVGNSHSFQATTQFFDLEKGVIKRIGTFSSATSAPYDDKIDGVFFESHGDDENHFLCIYYKGNAILRLPRNLWTDKLDGTGASGLEISWKGLVICECDYLLSGGKGARFYFMVDNQKVCVYNYNHAGKHEGTIMRDFSQPIRYELRGISSTGRLYWHSASVYTEGSPVSLPIATAVHTEGRIDANSRGVNYLLIAFRLNEKTRNSAVALMDFNAMGLTSDGFIAKIYEEPKIDGAALSWKVHSEYSGLEFAVADTASDPSTNTVTDGTLLSTSNSSNRFTTVAGAEFKGRINTLGRYMNGKSVIYALVVEPLSTNLDASGSLNFTETIS